jgi:hypothetical protein
MERRFMLVDWFFSALESRDEDEDLIFGARNYANELRKVDPRMASELDAAIDRRETELEIERTDARPTAGN